MRVDGKFFEFCGCGEGLFLSRCQNSKVGRKKTSVIRLGVDEFRCLARELAGFCFAKGDPLWVSTFKVLGKVVRGSLGDACSKPQMGWRCRHCRDGYKERFQHCKAWNAGRYLLHKFSLT